MAKKKVEKNDRTFISRQMSIVILRESVKIMMEQELAGTSYNETYAEIIKGIDHARDLVVAANADTVAARQKK